MKLFEEKQEHDQGQENRFTKEGFLNFQRANHQERTKKAISLLFKQITQNKDLEEAQMFDATDKLANRLNDDFVLKYFIETFEEYQFYKEKIDGLGAAYEVLGKLSGKDVIVGQFFTPENVVRFMVKLTELDPENVVLDPACGTARYLIKSMEDMVNKVQDRPDKKTKEDKIKKTQLFGDDHDTQVAKLAKMNMYIHGDGKTNILDQDGLMLSQFDDKIDVILTNPPLGDLSYTMEEYDSPKDEYRLKRMVTIPRKSLTVEKLEQAKEKLEDYQVRLRRATELGTQKDIKKFSVKSKEWQDKIGELEYKIRS
jgi:type I restriction-modification system DNA methylase subunit